MSQPSTVPNATDTTAVQARRSIRRLGEEIADLTWELHMTRAIAGLFAGGLLLALAALAVLVVGR